MECLIIPAVVSVKIAPEGLVVYLELKPLMLTFGICEIPCINRIRPPEKKLLFVEIPSSHCITEGKLEGGHQIPDKRIVAGRLPCEPRRLDKPELGIGLHGGPDILGPVFALARKLFGEGCKVIKDTSVLCLVVGKMTYGALQVFFGIPQRPHHVRIIPYPD